VLLLVAFAPAILPVEIDTSDDPFNSPNWSDITFLSYETF
jgi:hypothetical protein